ncbi:MAG: glycosyltransferase family 25 protein [Cyanobacteria bacterium P01_H01_bin.15]
MHSAWLPINIMVLPICLLNLKRRRDRRERFEQQNQQPDLEFTIVEAIDGATLDLAQLKQAGLLIGKRCEDFPPGQVGCSFSHRELWQLCIRDNRPMIICEDDAVLRNDFARAFRALFQQLPANWDFLLLGYNFDSILDVEIVPGVSFRGGFSEIQTTPIQKDLFIQENKPVSLFNLNNAFGACTYAISPEGAKKILQLCFPLTPTIISVPALNRNVGPSLQIDIHLNAHYRNLKAFCCIPPLAITPNDAIDSDTLNCA